MPQLIDLRSWEVAMSPLSATAILAAILSVNFAHGFDNSTSNIGPVGRRAKDTLVRLPRTGAEQVEPRQHLHRKWVSDIFMEAREAFDMHGDVSAACRRDFAVYQQFLENQTVWAIRSKFDFPEHTSKYTYGI